MSPLVSSLLFSLLVASSLCLSEATTSCVVTDWSAWGPCDRYTETQMRSRTVDTASFPCATQTQTQTCYIDCVISDWVNSGACDMATLLQKQTKTVLVRNSAHGKACPWTMPTQKVPCKIDCTVSAWTNSGSCSFSGSQHQVRTVITPANGGGLACPSLIQDIPCFSQLASVGQIYCNGYCSNWGLSDMPPYDYSSCSQTDADVFCELKTGNPSSVATSYNVVAALASPGICCPAVQYYSTDGCTDTGIFDRAGVPVRIHPTNLQSTHGNGEVIVNVICT
jgi:hypothetical protein